MTTAFTDVKLYALFFLKLLDKKQLHSCKNQMNEAAGKKI